MASVEARGSLGEFVTSDLFGPGLSYQEIHQRYAGSIYGLHQATQKLRYSQQYEYERNLMLGDLGDDVHPVRHMSYTESKIAVPLLCAQIQEGYHLPTSRQIVALRLGALVHDIGESEHPAIAEAVGATIGDIHYETKQASDAKQEVRIRRLLYDRLYQDVPPGLLDAAEEAIEDQETFAGLAFNTIERIGYYKTAVRAGEVALTLYGGESEAPSLRLINLSRLAIKVSNNHREVLQARSELFPHAGYVLEQGAGLDERIHAELSEFARQPAAKTT